MVTSTSDGDLSIGAGGTKDGDHTWGAGGTELRKKGGDWHATISFSAPVPADKLTLVYNDLDIDTAIITVTIAGTASRADFAIDAGYSYRPDFNYDPSSGQLTPPSGVLDNASQLFGNSADTVTSISIVTTGIKGDYTSARFGFVVEPASYSISKEALDAAGNPIHSAKVGDSITYRVTFTNTAVNPLTGVVITDTLPDHVELNTTVAIPLTIPVYNPGPPATLTWSVGDVASGGSAQLNMDMSILSTANQQVITNLAEVTAVDAPAAPGEAASASLVVGSNGADLEILDVSAEDLGQVFGGYKTRFTIQVRNNGPGVAEGLTVTYQYSNAAGDPVSIRSDDPVGDLLTCEDNPTDRQFDCSLSAPHFLTQDATMTHVIEVTRSGNISRPKVTVSSTTTDPDLSNNTWSESAPEGLGPGLPPIWNLLGEDSSEVPCFISTLTYGSYMKPEVLRLQNFRDYTLLTNTQGREFVE